MIFVYLLILNLHAVTCDLLYAPKKIEHLSAELICSNSNSLKTCEQLVFSKPKTNPLVKLESDNCCGNETKVAFVSPMTYAAKKTLDQLKDVKGVLSNQYVNSIEDFYHHTQLHRKRVKKLGLELLKMYPDVFKGISERDVILALAEHDRAKISGLALADDKEQFYKKLYSGYQRRIDRPTIDKLNNIDKKYMERAHEVIGWQETDSMKTKHKKKLRKKKALLKLLENVADFVDRGMSPVSEEEFGRKMQKASEFMKGNQERKIAAALEQRYKKVIQGLEYSPPNDYQYRAIKFSMMLDTQKEKLKLKFTSKQLSVMTLLHKSLTGAKRTLTETLKLLASKAGMKTLMVADGVGLFFAGMDMGCDQYRGAHDWKKVDGACQPVEAITPKFIDFLNKPWDQQKEHLSSETHTCSILESTYKDSKRAAKVESCSSEAFVLTKNKLKLKVNSNAQGDVTSIELLNPNSFLDSSIHGVPERINIKPNGDLGAVCYRGVSMSTNVSCFDEDSSYLLKDNILKVKRLIQSSNFEIQKARYCCAKKLNPTEVKPFLRVNCSI